MSNEESPFRLYSFNLYNSDINALIDITKLGGGANITQALRSGIATEHYLRQAWSRGAKVFVEETDGTLRELVPRNHAESIYG